MDVISVFMSAAGAVGMVFLVGAAGTLMSGLDLLDESGLSDLSDLLFYLLYPCLVFTKITSSLSPDDLGEVWVLPVFAICYLTIGFGISRLAQSAGLIRVPSVFQEGSVAAVTWANGGYLPLALISALSVTVPEIARMDNPEAVGHSYVVVFIIVVSLSMWSICYPYLGAKGDGTPVWKRMINPPICAIVAALLVSMSPGVTEILYMDQPLMNGMMEGLTIMGDAAVPISIIVLGGNLWFAARSSDRIPFTQVTLLSALRLLVVPVFALGLYFGLDRLGILPDDPLLRVVLLIESITPTAISVLIICQLHNRAQKYLAYVQFWMYLFSTVTMIGWISVFVWVVY